MLRKIWVVLSVLLSFISIIARAEAVQQAYLIQNSGWMEPFYTDRTSPFKPLVKALVATTATGNEQITISAFNQSTAEHVSPEILYQGRASGDYGRIIDSLQVAYKPNSQSFADTDLNEAVKATVVKVFNGQPGIIWLLSNNRNSPNNSQDTASKNQEFYNLIHREPVITRVLAFPIGMPVTGQHYQAAGMMIYALAYGQAAADYLTALQQSGRIGRVLTQAPARLKPLDIQPVRLQLVEVKGNSQVRVDAATSSSALTLEVNAGITLPTAVIYTHMFNEFSPYTIEHAVITARFYGRGWNEHLPVSVTELYNMQPGESVDVVIKLPVPVAEIPSIWSWRALSQAGKQLILSGMVDIHLSQQRLLVNTQFIEHLQALFPGDSLPTIFHPPEEIKKSVTTIPVYLKIIYPLYPLLVVAGLAVGIVVLACCLVFWAGICKRYTVVVDGERRNITLAAFRSLVLEKDGKHVATVRRLWGTPKVIFVEPQHSVKVVR